MSVETADQSPEQIKSKARWEKQAILGWVFGAPLLVVLSLLAVIAAYQVRPDITLDVGGWGDRPYMENFNAGERVSDYTYRWTKGDSEIRLPAVGLNAPLRLATRLQGWRPAGPSPVVELWVNGERVGEITTSPEERVYELNIRTLRNPASDLLVELKTPTFVPEGDKRSLGVKLDWVSIGPGSGGSGLPTLPPLLPLLATPVTILGAYLALGSTKARRRWPSWGAAGVLAALLAGLIFARIWIAPYSGWIALAALGIYALTQRRAIVRWLGEWTFLLGERRLSLYLTVGITLIVVLLEVWVASQMSFVGHADYADNAVVARNVAAGRGFTVDYVAQFYQDYPASVSHPADTWPLLQPTLIAPFFAVLGPTVFASRLPNLLLMVALALVIYWIGSWLLDRRVGLLAALLTLVHPYFFEMAIYPINDLAFTLFFLLTASFFYRNSRVDRDEASVVQPPARRWLWGSWPMFALNGFWAGLLFLSKPIGIVLLAALLLWFFTLKIKRPGRSGSLRNIVIFGGTAFSTALPLFVRNLLTFGTPLYSTESYDAWILKYRPWENIYNVFNGDLPHPRLLVGYGADLVTGQIGNQFQQLFNSLGSGAVVPVAALFLAVMGVFTLRRERYKFLYLIILTFVAFTLFVNVYWHFELRYFVSFVPVIFLLAGHFLFWAADRLNAWFKQQGGEINWLGAFLAPLFVLWLAVPMLAQIADEIPPAVSKTDTVGAGEWLAKNTDTGVVVMTRNPWEVNFHSQRKTVMIPNADLSTILRVAEKYGASYLQLDHLNDLQMRPALKELYQGKEANGFKKVFAGTGVVIYRFPAGSSEKSTK